MSSVDSPQTASVPTDVNYELVSYGSTNCVCGGVPVCEPDDSSPPVPLLFPLVSVSCNCSGYTQSRFVFCLNTVSLIHILSFPLSSSSLSFLPSIHTFFFTVPTACNYDERCAAFVFLFLFTILICSLTRLLGVQVEDIQ